MKKTFVVIAGFLLMGAATYADEPLKFSVGEQVYNSVWGTGTIVEIQEGAGTATLALDYHPEQQTLNVSRLKKRVPCDESRKICNGDRVNSFWYGDGTVARVYTNGKNGLLTKWRYAIVNFDYHKVDSGTWIGTEDLKKLDGQP